MSGFRRFFGLLPPRTSGETSQALGDPAPVSEFEPKTGLRYGIWFHDEKCWMYRGLYPTVLQFHKKTPEHIGEPYYLSKCPACEASTLRARFGPRIKRWIILPP